MGGRWRPSWLRPTVEEPDTREHWGLRLLSGLTQPGASGGAFLNPAPGALSCCPSETSLGPRLPPPGFTAVLGCEALAGILPSQHFKQGLGWWGAGDGCGTLGGAEPLRLHRCLLGSLSLEDTGSWRTLARTLVPAAQQPHDLLLGSV